MRVDELRKELVKYDVETLRKMVVALYKAIPKNKKEELGLDEMIMNYDQSIIQNRPKDIPVDFEKLRENIEQFIIFADRQYYFAPNRYVHKEKRSKWRFEVKGFIKALLATKGEEGAEAATLLAAIYEMLCYACHFYIFNTENPFSATGYEQTELLQLVINKLFYDGVDANSVRRAVFLTLDSNVASNMLHSYLIYTLIGSLKTPDAREMALEACKEYRKDYNNYQISKKVFTYSKVNNYRKKEHENYAVELYLLIQCSRYEYDEGINYFLKNYQEGDKEICLYVLLQFLETEELNDLWIREYDKAVAAKIRPRTSLREKYAQLKEAGD